MSALVPWFSLLLAGLLGSPAWGAPATVIEGEGAVRSDARIELKPRVSGRIKQIPVREGQAMRAGDLLVEMDNEREQALLEEANTEVKRAEAVVAQAELALTIATRELERNKTVEDLITAKELELSRDAVRSASTALQTRQEELARARAQLVVAKANYDATFLKADFDGVVSRIYLRPGATPKAAETTILDFLTLDKLFVEIALPLTHLRRVRDGLDATLVVEGDTPAVRTTTTGQVVFVYPEADPTIRMFRVKVGVQPRELAVLPGMLARVRIQLPSRSAREP